jgi:hypothetical protein
MTLQRPSSTARPTRLNRPMPESAATHRDNVADCRPELWSCRELARDHHSIIARIYMRRQPSIGMTAAPRFDQPM